MSHLIPVSKGADYLEVHPNTLAEHKKLGWTQCAKHQAAAAQDGEGDKGVSDKLGVAELRGKLVELGIEFDPKAKKADLQALLDAAAQDGEGV